MTDLFKEIGLSLLSWLLHHANRNSSTDEFYSIKKKLLDKYGSHIGYDVQSIAGKICYSCQGSGYYDIYDESDVDDWEDPIEEYQKRKCTHCGGTGWWKKPVWNILGNVKLGKYHFHQPFARVYEKPDNDLPLIHGYIKHNRSPYGDLSLTLLYLMFDRGYFRTWYKRAGSGWYCNWWKPQNYIENLVHIIKHGVKSYPCSRVKDSLVKLLYFSWIRRCANQDLPF